MTESLTLKKTLIARWQTVSLEDIGFIDGEDMFGKETDPELVSSDSTSNIGLK